MVVVNTVLSQSDDGAHIKILYFCQTMMNEMQTKRRNSFPHQNSEQLPRRVGSHFSISSSSSTMPFLRPALISATATYEDHTPASHTSARGLLLPQQIWVNDTRPRPCKVESPSLLALFPDQLTGYVILRQSCDSSVNRCPYVVRM